MITRKIGGDRVGSGSKMEVEMHGYSRSTHNLNRVIRTTASPGTLIPIMVEVCLPGDTWDIEIEAEALTHPTIGPLFGSFKLQVDGYEAPMRLYNALMHNNEINIGRNIAQVKLPQILLYSTVVDDSDPTVDIDNSQINPSCVLKYLGISGVGIGPADTEREFNGVPYLAYWEIYKNYYANKQEEIGAMIHTPVQALVETVDAIEVAGTNVPQAPATATVQIAQNSVIQVEYTGATPVPSQILFVTQYHGVKSLADLCSVIDTNTPGLILAQYNFAYYGVEYLAQWRYRLNTDLNQAEPQVVTFPLENIDLVRRQIMANGAAQYYISQDTGAPYSYAITKTNGVPNALSSQEGLALKTYQSDMFNNWISTEWIDGPGGVNEVSAIQVVDDVIMIDQINLAKKVYNMMNRIAMSGGTYYDWLEVIYDHRPMIIAETPMYCGGLSKELIFQEVVSNSAAAEDGTQPLGTLAGKGRLSSKHKGGKMVIKPGEPGYIMLIASLTPRIDYSQGNSWDTRLKTLDDLHKPELDQIGFQDLQQEEMAWWTTTRAGDFWDTKSVGKQPAWLNYMTAVNKTYGNFAIKDNEMFMTLNRRYEYGGAGGQILDMTTYIDPVKFNFIFAETSLDAQNFWLQFGIRATVRRKMSAKLMPQV